MSSDANIGQLLRSPSARGPQNVMQDLDLQIALSDAFKEQAQQSAKDDPHYYEPQAQSPYESVFIDPEPERSVFDDLDEGQNIDRTPDVSNTAQFLLDPGKPAPGAEQIHERAVDCKVDTEEKLEKVEQDWDEHQQRAAEYMDQAAHNLADTLGIEDPGTVKQQFLPQNSTTKAGAAAGLGSMALPGAGPAGGAVDLVKEMKGSELTREQKIALIKETVRIAQEEGTPKDTLAAKSSSGGGAPAAAPDQVAMNLAKLTEAKMEKLLTERVEDQPEYQALADIDHDLTYILDINHPNFAEEYGKENVGEKVVAHAMTGDTNMQEIVVEASTVQASFDSSHAYLCGDCVAGYEGFNQKAVDLAGKMDLSSVQTVVELNSSKGTPVYEKAQDALYNFAQSAMSTRV